jgi:hypothetical protein
MMTRLARERNRSALAWSLIGVAVWIGSEFAVAVGLGLIYGVGAWLFGWPDEISPGLRFVLYIAALGAAIASLTIVRRILCSRSRDQALPLPPPPPIFKEII